MLLSEDSFQVLFESSKDAMLLLQGEILVEANQAAVDLFDCNGRDQLKNCHFSELLPEFQPDGCHSLDKLKRMIACAMFDRGRHMRWLLSRATGEGFLAEILLTPLSSPEIGSSSVDDHGLIHMVVRDLGCLARVKDGVALHSAYVELLIREQTRKIAEERDHADALLVEKGRFFRNMSHELRTPLNAIIGLSGTMEAELFGPIENEKYHEYIHDIACAGDHLLSLVNNILDLSAIEEGKLSLDEDVIDIEELVDCVHRLVEPLAEKKNVKMNISVSSVMKKMYADGLRIKQILINLLSNAIKFTLPNGAVELEVSCPPYTGGITFTVMDTGIGMDAKEVSKCMEFFGQVKGKHRTDNNLTGGLGLPLTLGLVKLHGGEMDITSNKGVGTEITLQFPHHRTCWMEARVGE